MTFLFLGVAIGVLVMGLLKAWSRYEANSMAALRDEAVQMREVVQALTKRVEALEAIAAAETSDGLLDISLSEEPLPDGGTESQGRHSIPLSQAP